MELDIAIDKYIGFEDLEHDEKKFRLHIYTAHKVYENQVLQLNEHTNSAWVMINDLAYYDFPAIDLPFIEKLKIY